MIRVENMEAEAEMDVAEASFQARVESKRKECEERTRKNAEVYEPSQGFTFLCCNYCIFRNEGEKKRKGVESWVVPRKWRTIAMLQTIQSFHISR